MTEVSFPQVLHRFFHHWLVEQRNASHYTVISYRDTWRLFLRHAAAANRLKDGLTEVLDRRRAA